MNWVNIFFQQMKKRKIKKAYYVHLKSISANIFCFPDRGHAFAVAPLTAPQPAQNLITLYYKGH